MNFHSTVVAPTCSIRTLDALKLLKKLPDDSIDLLFSSPPYFIGKSYDTSKSLVDFRTEISRIIPEIQRVVKPSGSICWQVGNHVEAGAITPLDSEIIVLMRAIPDAKLRNRVIWHFGHGAHANRKLSGRHETILWYTLSDDYIFDLDPIREKQKYPGKRHYKGPKKGQFSGNPMGKNPGDVWEMPNVKANHVEKTEHPCQFPVALPQRFIKALVPMDGTVLDPYVGSGSTAIAAASLGRNFVGADIEKKYASLARKRLKSFLRGELSYREDAPTMAPDTSMSVAQPPEHFWKKGS
jgi:adenine-specific DNA-methyltransferase